MTTKQVKRIEAQRERLENPEYKQVRQAELEAAEHEAYLAFKLGRFPSYKLISR